MKRVLFIVMLIICCISCEKDKPVEGITLNKTTLVLEVGVVETLTVSIFPNDADNKDVIWTSSKTEVVIVDATGKVSAVSEGSATINVTTVDGNMTFSCDVTVIPAGYIPIFTVDELAAIATSLDGLSQKYLLMNDITVTNPVRTRFYLVRSILAGSTCIH